MHENSEKRTTVASAVSVYSFKHSEAVSSNFQPNKNSLRDKRIEIFNTEMPQHRRVQRQHELSLRVCSVPAFWSRYRDEDDNCASRVE